MGRTLECALTPLTSTPIFPLNRPQIPQVLLHHLLHWTRGFGGGCTRCRRRRHPVSRDTTAGTHRRCPRSEMPVAAAVRNALCVHSV